MISFDNLRGLIDLQSLESFLTEPMYAARIPYRPTVFIDTWRIVLFATSNEAELTRDLANRALCIRILKQPIGYPFATFPEGDLLAHLQQHQSRYLGAVFALIKAWWDAGCPRTNDTRHNFRAPCQTLDWIVQQLLGLPPLLDGHDEVHQRMTNPGLTWLRKLAVAVVEQKQYGKMLRTGELVDICEQANLEIPGVDRNRVTDDTRYQVNACQLVGRKMKMCFQGSDIIILDRIKITRFELDDDRESHGVRMMKVYQFEQVEATPTTATETPAPSTNLFQTGGTGFEADKIQVPD